MGENVIDFKEITVQFEQLLNIISKIPGMSEAKEKLERLKSLIIERRPPRIAAIGRRGSGKSSLVNALLDSEYFKTGSTDTTKEDQWVSLKLHGNANVDWLDTPGTGAGGIKEVRLQKLKESISAKQPDAILVVLKADEIDSEIDATLSDLKEIISMTTIIDDNLKCPVYAVVNQVDKLNPSTNNTPPYKEKKQKEINIVVKKAEEHLKRYNINVKTVIPVASYFNKEDDEDIRYNIDELTYIIIESLPEIAQFEAAKAFKEADKLRKELSTKIIKLSSIAAGVIAAEPIPIAEFVPLTILQTAMILAIAYLGGAEATEEEAVKFLKTLGISIAIGAACRTIAKTFIPIIGEVISGVIAFTGTQAIGYAAEARYIDNKSIEEVKEVFRNYKKRGKEMPEREFKQYLASQS